MNIAPFELERWQSVHEHHVEINLSESGVEPLRVSELLGARMQPWRLREQTLNGTPRWAPDLEELRALVTARIKLIIVCNPNNPTGARLADAEVAEVCAVAGRHGAWVLSDEIYRGVEHDGRSTASAWGRYDRAVVTSGLSKAYGLPGLRIGWAVAPASLCQTLWSYRDFTTIAPAALSDRLARIALAPDCRSRLLARARRRIEANYPIVRDWVARMGNQVRHIPPEAGAIAFVGYTQDAGSMELADRLRHAHSVLVAPGAHFGLDGYLRIGFGHGATALGTGLDRLSRLLGPPPPSPQGFMHGTDGTDLVLIGLWRVARHFCRLLNDERTRLPCAARVVGSATANHGYALAPDGIEPGSAGAAIGQGESLATRHDRTSGPPPASALDLLGRLARLRVHRRDNRRLVVIENTPLGLDGGHPSVDHVRAAIDVGADVITANKGPAAFAYRELRDRAASAGVAFRFEGTVLDGLPLFSLIRETLPAVGIRSVRGVVNTTTNYVLSAMARGRSLDDAVRDMQEASIAETDPTSDIDGWDAAAKAAVLANVLFDADLTPHDVEREGLPTVDPATVRAAHARGGAVKLVAAAHRVDGRVRATVGAEALPANDPLAHLSATAKGLVLATDRLGRVFIGKDSSHLGHTAYALVADLISIQRTSRTDT